MTTTPAPTDLDTLKALGQAAFGEYWSEAAWTWGDFAGTRITEDTARFLEAALNALPALLDELAKTRAELERLRATNGCPSCAAGACDEYIHLSSAHIGDLTRDLAATHTELDEIKGKIAHPTVKGVLDLVELCEERWHKAEAAHEAKDEANRRWLEAEMAREALANPTTTAQPADEPKAT